MGQDKHRKVVGESGHDRKRQFIYYGIAIAVVVLLYFGAMFAVDKLDKAPAKNPDQAPWSQQHAPQAPPQDFQ